MNSNQDNLLLEDWRFEDWSGMEPWDHEALARRIIHTPVESLTLVGDMNETVLAYFNLQTDGEGPENFFLEDYCPNRAGLASDRRRQLLELFPKGTWRGVSCLDCFDLDNLRSIHNLVGKSEYLEYIQIKQTVLKTPYELHA